MVSFVVVKTLKFRQHYFNAVNPTTNNKNIIILCHINLFLGRLVSFYHRLADY